jgi:hypothetical protein
MLSEITLILVVKTQADSRLLTHVGPRTDGGAWRISLSAYHKLRNKKGTLFPCPLSFPFPPLPTPPSLFRPRPTSQFHLPSSLPLHMRASHQDSTHPPDNMASSTLTPAQVYHGVCLFTRLDRSIRGSVRREEIRSEEGRAQAFAAVRRCEFWA